MSRKDATRRLISPVHTITKAWIVILFDRSIISVRRSPEGVGEERTLHILIGLFVLITGLNPSLHDPFSIYAWTSGKVTVFGLRMRDAGNVSNCNCGQKNASDDLICLLGLSLMSCQIQQHFRQVPNTNRDILEI